MYRHRVFAALTVSLTLIFTFTLLIALMSSLQSSKAIASSSVPPAKKAALTPTPTTACRPWTVVPNPDVGQTGSHYLNSIEDVSANDVWAVGYYGSANDSTLIEHWDGTQWTIVPSPNPIDSVGARLYSVAATAANDVWAVGYYSTSSSSVIQPVALHWDGVQWNISLALSTLNTPNRKLLGVTAVATDDVWAVGYSYQSAEEYSQTFIMHYNGIEWSVTLTANLPDSTRLYSVSAVSANDIWAVGSRQLSIYPENVFVVHWNGSGWQAVAGVFGGLFSRLYSVSARAADDVWAVGTSEAMGTIALALIMHWNGSNWSAVTNSNLPDAALKGVSAVSADKVWAVGSVSISGISHNFVEMWNGSVWSEVLVRDAGEGFNELSGVDALASNDAWAVGDKDVGVVGRYGAFTQHYTGGITFTDVTPNDYFYEAVNWLHCGGAVSGYSSDNTYRPYNNTTRAQLSKMLTLIEGWQLECPATPTFSDVLPDNPFYCYIETAFAHGVISGYQGGTFRPGNDVTRGQLCKIIALAEGWQLLCPAQPHFSDAPASNPFYCYIETAYSRGVISGYSDGTFRYGNPAIRGQIAKIVYQALNAR